MPQENSLASRKVQRYGWVPDLPDARDHMYAVTAEALSALPPQVDLRPGCPAVYDQGQLGSCTANAIAGAYEFDQLKQKLDDFVPSRLFIYYNERVIEGTVGEDSGAMIRDGIKSVNKLGVCTEEIWPYDIATFTQKPPTAAFDQAQDHQAIAYRRVRPVLRQMQGCLAEGTPFVVGFSVYESFESAEVAKTGVVPLPAAGERLLGGHAVLVVGYDDATQRFLLRNSWGEQWAMSGYFTMPYAYLTDRSLAADFWAINAVEQPAGAPSA